MTFSIPDFSDDEIIGSLKSYQKNLINQLLADHDEETAAKIWLSSTGPLDLRRFGGDQSSNGDAFYQRFLAEFREYVCGGKRYKKDRDELMKIAKPVANYFVTGISVAIAGTLGVAVGLVVPAVALLLRVLGKIGLNAYCKVGS